MSLGPDVKKSRSFSGIDFGLLSVSSEFLFVLRVFISTMHLPLNTSSHYVEEESFLTLHQYGNNPIQEQRRK